MLKFNEMCCDMPPPQPNPPHPVSYSHVCEKVTFVLTQVLGALRNMAPMHTLFFGSRG